MVDARHAELHSPAIGAPGNVVAYGHWGRPFLAFPAERGNAWEYGDRGVVGELSELIDGGRAKLIDLSVATRARRCRPGVGTWCYLAPEQARGGPISPAADVWGIGGVLFEAATGECAFDRLDTDDDAEFPQLERRAEPVASLRDGLDEPFATVIDACLHPDPTERPSLRDLAAGCEEAAALPPAERRARPLSLV